MTEQRYQAVLDVISERRTFMEVASQWGVNGGRCTTGWRHEAEGLEGLPDRSHRPERFVMAVVAGDHAAELEIGEGPPVLPDFLR